MIEIYRQICQSDVVDFMILIYINDDHQTLTYSHIVNKKCALNDDHQTLWSPIRLVTGATLGSMETAARDG